MAGPMIEAQASAADPLTEVLRQGAKRLLAQAIEAEVETLLACYADERDAQGRQAENAFSRLKRTFGGGLRSKRDESQEREAALACELLNRMQARGRPQSYAVS